MRVETNRSVGKAIRSLNNMIARRFDAGRPDREVLERITGTNRWVIGYLVGETRAGREVYQRDLEQVFGVTRSTVSKVLDLMAQKGLIERQSVERDGRMKKLVPLPKALELSERMCAYGESMEKALLKGFSPEEVETLFSYIDRMKKNLGEP